MAKSEKPLILVADDEPSTLALVASHLRGKGYRVIEASDGDDAWGQACRELPDLVVLDVMMPGMSGWEVCRKIREAVSLAHTGIVMLTGIGETLNELTSPLYGADAYLDKPFQFNQLAEVVKKTLAARQGGTLGRPGAEAATAGAPRGGANGRPAARPWDAEEAGKTSGKTPGSQRRAKDLLAEASAPEMKTTTAPKATTARKPAKKATAETTPASPARGKTVTGKTTAGKKKTRKAPAKKAPGKKAPAKKAPGKKAPARKAPAKKAPGKKAPARKAPGKKKTAAGRAASAGKKTAKKAAASKAKTAPAGRGKQPRSAKTAPAPSRSARPTGKARRKNVA